MEMRGKGKINICELCGTELKNQCVEYSIDTEKHYLDLDFGEIELSYNKGATVVDTVELIIEGDVDYTFFNCWVTEVSKHRCKLRFETSLTGTCSMKIDEILCSAVEYTINANPIPLVAISFLPEISEIESVNVVIKCEAYNNDVLITLEAKNGVMTVDEFETIFFNILDITFLINGYYPFIIKEILNTGEKRIEINRMQQHLYKKGHSYSHWSKSIASGRDLDLNDIYPKYLNNVKKNKIIIPVLRSVVHSNDVYADLILCNLIQCVEGYMRKFHIKEKFSKTIVNEVKREIDVAISKYQLPDNSGTTIEKIHDSVMGLVGNINQPNFNECLDIAINMNENTKAIFDKEIENNQLEGFINKSKKTRNQFSHMVPIKDSIEEAIETYHAIEKYSMLLRVIILTDFDISISNNSVKKYITGITEG